MLKFMDRSQINHNIEFSKIIHKYHLLKIVFDIHFMLQHKICLYDITDACKNSYKFSNKRPLSSLHLIYDYPFIWWIILCARLL